MLIIPSIDIKNGKCVRLTKGDFDTVKIYSNNPVDVAKSFEKQGAKMIHVVDLDGAQTGEMKNKKIIEQIASSVRIPIQVGGGIRYRRLVYDTASYAGRVVLGTSAIESQKFLKEIISEFKDKIVVSLDAENGKLKTKGWAQTTDKDVFNYAKKLESLGVKTIIFTDIARDGMLSAPNFSSIVKLRTKVQVNLIASGGVSSLEDLKKLKAIGVDGVIIGKAIYEGRINLKEAIDVS